MDALAIFATGQSEAHVLEADPADGSLVVRVHHQFQTFEVDPDDLHGLISVLAAARDEVRSRRPQ